MMKKIVKDIFPYIIIIIVVVLIKNFLFAPIRVIGPSMMNTLLDGDIMILDRIKYRFKEINRFDIVVINHDNNYIIKRIIGIPGDNLEYRNNKLYINNKEYKENYLDKDTLTYDFSLEQITGLDIIPEGYYFVLGDNREESADSRIIGLVKEENIEGNANFIVFPFSRLGSKT